MTTKALPDGVRAKLTRLKRIETELGHLPPEKWAVEELERRSTDPEFPFFASQWEQETELLFGDICDELSVAGFEPAEIAVAVNGVLNYPGGPRYCNEAEVREVLGVP